MSIYKVILLLHVASAFIFIMAHGVSAMVMLLMPQQRDRNRICFLLEITGKAIGPAMRALDVAILTGLAMTFMAGWQRYAWPWIALTLIFVIGYFMGKFGSAYMGRVRRAMGAERPGKKRNPRTEPLMPASFDEMVAVLESGRPRVIATIGLSGLATILVMMVMKPF